MIGLELSVQVQRAEQLTRWVNTSSVSFAGAAANQLDIQSSCTSYLALLWSYIASILGTMLQHVRGLARK